MAMELPPSTIREYPDERGFWVAYRNWESYVLFQNGQWYVIHYAPNGDVLKIETV